MCSYSFEENKAKGIVYKALKKNLNFFQKIEISNYEDLKNELKMLYTGITRAKQNLIIFDETIEQRVIFEKVLQPFELMEYILDEYELNKYVTIFSFI